MKTKQFKSSHQNFHLLKKAISIMLFVTGFYVLPLAAKPQLLINWKVILLAAVCSLLYATQLRVSLTESKNKKATDRNTMLLILIVSSIGQIVSLLEWAYLQEQTFFICIITGIMLLIGGALFRLYAIQKLGRYFSSVVQIKQQHKIITAGPYKFLRHLSYTGAFIAMLGCAVLLQSILGILIFGVGMLYVYHLRIKTEEQTLLQSFKEEYIGYCSGTWKMFPLIW